MNTAPFYPRKGKCKTKQTQVSPPHPLETPLQRTVVPSTNVSRPVMTLENKFSLQREGNKSGEIFDSTSDIFLQGSYLEEALQSIIVPQGNFHYLFEYGRTESFSIFQKMTVECELLLSNVRSSCMWSSGPRG